MPARLLTMATAALAVALGIASEAASFDLVDVRLWLPDLLVGWVLVGCGLVAAVRRPGSRSGVLLALAGIAWFVGNLADQMIFLHRGLLVHLLVCFPSGAIASRRAGVAVGAGYVTSLLPGVWDSAWVTAVLSGALVGYCALEHRRTFGVTRRARRRALAAASGLAVVLAAGALARATLPIDVVSRPALLAYQVTICAVAVGLLLALLGSDSERMDVTDLVVELGTARTRTLQSALSAALGDPSLELGYRDAGADAFVDADGRRLSVPDAHSRRAVTWVEHDGETLAALVHDPVVLEDPQVREAVAAATRLAVANDRLQSHVRARVAEVEASRRRILETRDDERARLERRLRDGAERRLLSVASVLEQERKGASPATTLQVGRAASQVDLALEELRRLARGIHPRLLAEEGLGSALRSLHEGFPVPVDLRVADTDRMPPSVVATAYFVCAEGLANVAKYASASRVAVSVAIDAGRLTVVVEDDGIGGADPARGSGLRGLADRVATVGGTLRVGGGPGGGTRLAAAIPLSRSWSTASRR